MKKLKKFASVLLAMIMALALAVPAFATDVVLTGEGVDHTFKAYQIFTGKIDQDGGSLKEDTIAWAAGVDYNKLWDVLCVENSEVFNNESKPANLANGAKDVAALLKANYSTPGSKYNTVAQNESLANAIASAKNPIFTNAVLIDGTNVVETGYCLITDEFGSSVTNMLWVVNETETTIKPKVGDATVDKTVWKPNFDEESAEEGETGWVNAAIYSAEQGGMDNGENEDDNQYIRFKIKITLPDNLSTYTNEGSEGYNLTVTDTQEAGLNFGGIESVKVYSAPNAAGVSTKIQELTNDRYGFEVTANGFVMNINNAQTLIGAEARGYIEIIYKATFNVNTVTGATGNNNNVKVSVNDNPPIEDDAKVFELELDVDKVDGKNQPLMGAGFTLYREDQVTVAANGTVTVKKVDDSEGAAEVEGIVMGVTTGTNHHSIKGKALKAGTWIYYLIETTAPTMEDGTSYNPIKPIKITVNSKIVNGKLKVTVTSDPSSFSADDMTQIVSAQIQNVTGTQLPETGGIGTTIFYIGGGILVLAAVVVLITKRRTNVDDE